MVTPRITDLATLSIPGRRGGIIDKLDRGRLNTISLDLLLLSFRLQVSAHVATFSSSEEVVFIAEAGIII